MVQAMHDKTVSHNSALLTWQAAHEISVRGTLPLQGVPLQHLDASLQQQLSEFGKHWQQQAEACTLHYLQHSWCQYQAGICQTA